jgi:cation:H+ antiporter
VLVAFLFQKQLTWHLAAVLLSLYAIYLTWLWIDARKYRVARADAIERLRVVSAPDDQQIRDALAIGGINGSPNLIDYVRRELGDDVNLREEVDDVETASFLFGWFNLRLSTTVAYTVLALSTLVTATACYWLVEVTVSIAKTLDIPIFFVAVIVAAAASSVPDTLLSVGAAKRGDDDGAVSNAFGSNIFDICICLSVPLIACLYLNNGEPIDLTVHGQPMPGLFGLQILLLTLTVITLGILAHRLKLTLLKSFVLVSLYFVFIGYAILGSLGF